MYIYTHFKKLFFRITYIMIILFSDFIYANQTDKYIHHGYYLSLELGPTTGAFLAKDLGIAEQVVVYKNSIHANINLGYAFIDNFIFYFSGGILSNFHSLLLKNSSSINNEQKNILLKSPFLLGNYGLNFLYYFPSNNIVMSTGILLMSGFFDKNNNISNYNNVNGIGFQTSLGKEWQVTNLVGLGILFRFTYARLFIAQNELNELRKNDSNTLLPIDYILFSCLFTTSIQWDSI